MNWSLEYQPTDYNQLALSPSNRKLFDNIIKEKKMGDFLFHSPQVGCGKSSMARILPKILNLDALFINASKDGNMDTIRNDIDRFMDYKSFGYDGKVIILDEAELISKKAQGSLRGILEDTNRGEKINFIFTTNNKSGIIEAISDSRILDIDFSLPSFNKKDKIFIDSVFIPILNYLESILNDNNIEYDSRDLMLLIRDEYPNIRKMVIIMEYSIFKGKFEPLNRIKKLDNEELINLIKSKDKKNIYNFLKDYYNIDNFVSYLSQNLEILYEVNKFDKAIEILNRYQKTKSYGVKFDNINNLDTIYSLLEV